MIVVFCAENDFPEACAGAYVDFESSFDRNAGSRPSLVAEPKQ
jgi:hypothetical protein